MKWIALNAAPPPPAKAQKDTDTQIHGYLSAGEKSLPCIWTMQPMRLAGMRTPSRTRTHGPHATDRGAEKNKH